MLRLHLVRTPLGHWASVSIMCMEEQIRYHLASETELKVRRGSTAITFHWCRPNGDSVHDPLNGR